jgi:hypothetical protein
MDSESWEAVWACVNAGAMGFKSWKSRLPCKAFATHKVGLRAEFPIAENAGVEYA